MTPLMTRIAGATHELSPAARLLPAAVALLSLLIAACSGAGGGGVKY